MESIPNKKYVCNTCNKEYSTRQNLWKHNKSSHAIIKSEISLNLDKTSDKSPNVSEIKENIKKYKCIKCNKIFNNRKTKWSHEQKCKETIENKLEEKENEIILLKQQLKEQNNKIKEELKKRDDDIELLKKQMIEIMNKQNKIHPKTLTKINKQLNNTITNTLNNTLNDNKVINNINIIQLGGESLDTLFNKNQQLDVLSKRYKCLEYLVKQVHFNDKYPQFKNILITNTQNNIAYRYDKNENKFIAINKNELLDDVITERMGDIETFYDNQLQYLDSKTKDIIHCFIDKMDDKSEKYYEQKMKDIKLVIYNNRDKVSKEITQDLEVIV
jgi:hypothetical protein